MGCPNWAIGTKGWTDERSSSYIYAQHTWCLLLQICLCFLLDADQRYRSITTLFTPTSGSNNGRCWSPQDISDVGGLLFLFHHSVGVMGCIYVLNLCIYTICRDVGGNITVISERSAENMRDGRKSTRIYAYIIF